MSSVLAVDNLSVSYGTVQAVGSVTFSVGNGVCAVLGPNGAGKTTLLTAIMGFRSFTGSISIGDGVPITSSRLGHHLGRNVGYLPQRFDLAPRFSAQETVAYAAWCNGARRGQCGDLATRALGLVGLGESRQKKVRTMSGGEKQRLGLACSVSLDPNLLLLDEPTVGLDPIQRLNLRGHLAAIAKKRCVILTTHLLEDVQAIADNILLIHEGRLAFVGTKEEMVNLGREGRGEYESPIEAAYRQLIAGEGG